MNNPAVSLIISEMKKILIICLCALIIFSGALLVRKNLSGSENPNVRGMMTSRLGFVKTAGTDSDKYIEEIKHQLSGNPGSSSLYTMLGAAYLQKARETADPAFYSDAEINLKKALELDSKNIEAMYQTGVLCLARHQFAEALEWGKSSAETNPYSGPIRGIIFDAQIELGMYDEALTTIQEMVNLRPDLTSYSRVSYYRELKGDLHGAIEAMQMAVNAGSPHAENTAWCRVQLGNLYLNSGEKEKAEDQYQRALLNYPFYYQALSAMGKLLFTKSDFYSAAEFYKKSIAVCPTAEAYIALGDIYKVMDQNDLAQEQYRKVRFISTLLKENGVDADMELAIFEADHSENPAEKLKDAQASLDKFPTIKSYNTLAWIHYKAGNFQEAEKYIAEALNLGTKEPLLYYHAGKIYEKTFQYNKARLYLEYALRINPNLQLLYN